VTEGPAADTLPEAVTFLRYARRREWSNFALLRHRARSGHLISMHQAGTHWLKFMVANALARRYQIPPPRFNHANDIFPGHRDPVCYPQIPHLLSGHSVPHPLICTRWAHRFFQLPPYVLLLRDLRDSLASNYAKWKNRYAESFSTYLRGAPYAKRYNADIWSTVRFLNAWSAVIARNPDRVLVVRYEILQQQTAQTLSQVASHWDLQLEEEDVAHAVASSSKTQMAARDDPGRPAGAVRMDDPEPAFRYSPADLEYVAEVCARYLHNTFGYDYNDGVDTRCGDSSS